MKKICGLCGENKPEEDFVFCYDESVCDACIIKDRKKETPLHDFKRKRRKKITKQLKALAVDLDFKGLELDSFNKSIAHHMGNIIPKETYDHIWKNMDRKFDAVKYKKRKAICKVFDTEEEALTFIKE